jgi:hypothetical protein
VTGSRHSYSTNEVAIDGNSPPAWVSSWARASQRRRLATVTDKRGTRAMSFGESVVAIDRPALRLTQVGAGHD